MLTRTLALWVGGAICLTLLTTTLLPADPIGSPTPHTLDRHTLWQIEGGSNNQKCCVLDYDCYNNDRCSDKDPVIGIGGAIACRAYREYQHQNGNDFHCVDPPNPNPDHHCTEAGLRVCLKRIPCKVIDSAGMQICVPDTTGFSWEDVEEVPEQCNGQLCGAA